MILTILGLSLLFFYPALSTYFTGDDFFHFTVAREGIFTISSFEQRGIAFYRPVSRELLYYTLGSLFGLNHLPFRVLQFALHFGNIYLVYVFVKRLFGDRIIAFFSTLFFALSAANVGILYYLAGGIQAQFATFFILLSALFFFKNRLASVAFFVLALGSHELAVMTPALLAGLVFVRRKNFSEFISVIKALGPYILLTLGYLYISFIAIGFSSTEAQYSLNFSPKTTLNTLSWYGVWALGLPEMTVDFVGSGLSLDPRLMRFWGKHYSFIFPAMAVVLLMLAAALLKLVGEKNRALRDKRLWVMVMWFVASLLPVLFLPVHKKTYYLAPGLLGFWTAFWYLILNSTKSRTVLAGVVVVLAVLNFSSSNLGSETYWAAKRGLIAEKLVKDLKSEFPSLPSGATLYIKNEPAYPKISGDWGGTSNQANFILNGSDAVRLLYDDPRLEVFYEDLHAPPEGDYFEHRAVLQFEGE